MLKENGTARKASRVQPTSEVFIPNKHYNTETIELKFRKSTFFKLGNGNKTQYEQISET
jgi:hypothetical protein